MSHVKRMEKEDKLVKLLRQSRNGIRINDLAKKLGIHRSTVYDYLNSLVFQELAYYEKGIAYPKKLSAEEVKLSSKIDIHKLIKNIIFVIGLTVLASLLVPIVFNEVGSVNMTAWNFTGVESARTIMTLMPYLYAFFLALVILYFSIDIFKISRRRFYHCFLYAFRTHVI